MAGQELMSEQDPLGLWYSLLEREHGEDMGIRFGRASLTGGAVEWRELPHHRYDGVGGLWELHRRRYGGEGAAPIPAPRERRRPGPLALWWHSLRFTATLTPPVAAWRGLEPTWRGRSPEHSRSSTLSWRVLEPEQTQALVESTRGAGVSVTSLLLWALGRAIEPALELARGPVRWIIPVNMRGAITRESATANHSAYVFAETPPGGSVPELDRSIRTHLARQDHFAAWNGFVLGAALGPRRLGRLIDWGIRRGATSIGVFSNLGVWPEREDSRGADEVWLVCPPVQWLQPIGAGVLTWRGRLALTLQTHPALRVDAAEVARWLDTWVAGAVSFRASARDRERQPCG